MVKRYRPAKHGWAALTPKQWDILEGLTVTGGSDAVIAEMLGSKQHTVATHMVAIFVKIGVHSRTELVVKAHRDGVVNPQGLVIYEP